MLKVSTLYYCFKTVNCFTYLLQADIDKFRNDLCKYKGLQIWVVAQIKKSSPKATKSNVCIPSSIVAFALHSSKYNPYFRISGITDFYVQY